MCTGRWIGGCWGGWEKELTAVLRGLGEAAGAGAVVGPCDVVAVDDQRAAEKVLALVKGAVRCAGVHVCQATLHVVVGEHADVVDTQGFEDELLEVVVQGHAGHSLHYGTRPINVHLNSISISMLDCRDRQIRLGAMPYPVFPFGPGFEGER